MLILFASSHTGLGADMSTERNFRIQIEQSHGSPKVYRLHRLFAPTEEETGRRAIGAAKGSDRIANHSR